ncbi:MAG: CYTH domain-containing protein [Bacteroidales bacterium]|nr:CYTH domain-containing protein [Bacteroidales bacterium]
MHTETERKFLVNDMSFIGEAVQANHIIQGYIAHGHGRSVRVRISDDNAYLTIKGPSPEMISRLEWEMPIPLQDAKDLLKLHISSIVEKTRYIIPTANGRKFEVDVFHGDNEGLVVAEIELGSPDEPFEKPLWLGEEVTMDKRYKNTYLAACPYKNW